MTVRAVAWTIRDYETPNVSINDNDEIVIATSLDEVCFGEADLEELLEALGLAQEVLRQRILEKKNAEENDEEEEEGEED